MKKLLFLIITISFVFGVTKEDIYNLYKNQNYKKTCIRGTWILSKYLKDDEYQSIVALSCVKADMLNTAIRIAKTMTHTSIGRNNASYISSLFLTKKLLLQMIYDNIDISNLSLPKSDHPLSILFESISHHNFSKVANKYIVKNNNLKYILEPYKTNKFIIKIYKDDNIISTHIYW